jgi:hypothetical protein
VGIDDGRSIIFFGDFIKKIIDNLDEVIKSRVGLITKQILGLLTIALAIATLFCIPPEISEGYFLSALSRCTLPITSKTLFFFSL